MTFAVLKSTDFAAIARAEATRRIRAAKDNADVTDAMRRDDERKWSLIERRARYFADDRIARLHDGEGAETVQAMAAVVHRTAQAALRKWREGGKPGGEPEARAFLLFALTRKFAELASAPTPYVDADGNIYFLEPERTAA